MKNIVKIPLALAVGSLLLTGCIKETAPQSGTATREQVANAPGAFSNAVVACTTSLVGPFLFGSQFAWDFGYPSFFLQRDVMGQDLALEDSGTEHYTTWYSVANTLGPTYMACQAPWTYYYRWINNCNIVLDQAGETPTDSQKSGVGIARAMRAMFYMDLARMYQYTYKGHEQDGTVPLVTEKTTIKESTNNPRISNEKIWAFIIADLDAAETLLTGYNRPDIYTPNVSVVYGLKARAYLTMENFPKAEEYAHKAQVGYTQMTQAQYLDRMTAFNTPNSAWMFGLKYKETDKNITENDSDTNWGSQMFLEVQGGLYGSAYGVPKRIDAHLYSTIPATDFRKGCYIDPALDGMASAARTTALGAYSSYPALIDQAVNASASKKYGCLALKFRAGGGTEGRTNPYKATVVSVPMMRIEEMILIEAEAIGMQTGKEAQGITLLTQFAQTRDPSYVYNVTESFRNNVWWQRRVELWGEGFATFDIKRLNKGIVRSYAGTNHPVTDRYNTSEVPVWMNLCIVQTEATYNPAIVNNPTPVRPSDSPPYVF